MILANKDNRLADQSYDFSGDSKTLLCPGSISNIKGIKPGSSGQTGMILLTDTCSVLLMDVSGQ